MDPFPPPPPPPGYPSQPVEEISEDLQFNGEFPTYNACTFWSSPDDSVDDLDSFLSSKAEVFNANGETFDHYLFNEDKSLSQPEPPENDVVEVKEETTTVDTFRSGTEETTVSVVTNGYYRKNAEGSSPKRTSEEESVYCTEKKFKLSPSHETNEKESVEEASQDQPPEPEPHENGVEKEVMGNKKKQGVNGPSSGKAEGGESKLRVFQLLDEYNASDDNDEKVGYVSDSSISDDEVEALLEEGFQKAENEEAGEETKKPIQYMEKTSIMLEELGHNHFDVLPEGWIKIIHKSGMPVYLHKSSRVCTFSRPYYLGQGSARKHAVPLSSIPCLQYKRALEKEKEEETKKTNDNIPQNGLGIAKIETAEENKESQSLPPEGVREYCSSLFRFKSEQRLHFFSWADRRRFAKARKLEKHQQRPTFPDGTKLIKFPIHNLDEGPNAKPKGEWIMNPNGKSYICILHEYVQHALKKQPTYEFRSLENPAAPYAATVVINGMRYGFGTGTSKKQAKLAAAKASLEILIPEMREKIRGDNNYGVNRERKSKDVVKTSDESDSLAIFDEIKIEDPRVAEFCSKTTEPSPYAILLTCLQRNFGSKEMPINYTVNPLHRQMNEFIMTVGKHTARVVCKNKKDGKQRASQAILQALHPHISSWGSLLRLYGSKSMTSVKEKKQEEQEITMLQSKASLNSPNYAILNKLKSEMIKLHNTTIEKKPIGVFIPPKDVCLPSSGTELNKVDL